MSLSNRLRLSTEQWIILAIIAATAALHLAVAGRYDLMRNELYFLACGRHPAFGYADQPPLVPLIAAATQLFGESVWLLRLPAVIAATALVPVTAALARTLSGGRTATIVAAMAAATTLGIAAVTTTLTTATFEPIAWTLVAWLVARAIILDDRRAPLWAGLVVGLALEAKYGILLWLIPMALGLAVTATGRALLARRETWIGIAIAAVIAAPSLIWQAVHGWPFVEIIANHTPGNFTGGPLRFALGQINAANLLLAPLWVAGLIAPFVVDRLRPARFLAIAFAGAAALTWLTHGKAYYLFGAYPALFAVGAIVAARLWRWAIGLWLAACAANFVLIAPVLLPLLPPWRLYRLFEHSHLRPAPEEQAAIGAPLTQVFSEEMGWRELAGQVAAVYQALPPADRARTAIVASNYGEAAAIDIYGRRYGLPPAISGDNQYWLWGPRGYDGQVIVHINGNPDDWRARCASVTIAGRFGVPLAMPFERDRPIFVCRDLKGGLAAAWPALKRYGQ